jgi:hypothetical protein
MSCYVLQYAFSKVVFYIFMTIDTTVCLSGHKKKNAPGLLIAWGKRSQIRGICF